MNEGRPLLSQEASQPVAPAASQETKRIQLLYRKLLLSGFREQPFMEGQADAFPETVKVVSRKAEVLDLSKPQDIERYSVLMTSTAEQGREVIKFEELKAFDAGSNWKVILKIDVRAFRCLSNRQESDLLVRALAEEAQDDLDPAKDSEEDPTALPTPS